MIDNLDYEKTILTTFYNHLLLLHAADYLVVLIIHEKTVKTTLLWFTCGTWPVFPFVQECLLSDGHHMGREEFLAQLTTYNSISHPALLHPVTVFFDKVNQFPLSYYLYCSIFYIQQVEYSCKVFLWATEDPDFHILFRAVKVCIFISK